MHCQQNSLLFASRNSSVHFLLVIFFFLLACIFGKVSKGGVGSNKEENMTQSGTVQYVQGLGKNRPLSSNYLCTKQN